MTPVLETERLILREWRLEDFDGFSAFWADPDRTAHFISGTVDASTAWSMFCAMLGEWRLRGLGSFAVQEKTGSVLGYTGLWFPLDIEEPELLWSLYAGSEGKGFAIEAARRVQQWAAFDLKLPPLMSYVHPDNLKSQAVAKRLGATVEAETTLRGHPRLVFRHIHPENTLQS
ncbi:MAG: GNAT family N-acetyltransferase [Pseudomonadota bacterium]